MGYHLPAKQTITLIEQHQLWRDAFYWLARKIEFWNYVTFSSLVTIPMNKSALLYYQ